MGAEGDGGTKTRPWPAGAGEMSRLVREHDWAQTPLGPIGGWPPSLKTALEMVLAMPGPATILWGPAHVQLYNDAYVAVAGDRHPALLGRPAAEGWPEVHAEVLAPVMNAAFAGRATRIADLSVTLEEPNGRQEERAFDTTWSPFRTGLGRSAARWRSSSRSPTGAGRRRPCARARRGTAY